MKRGIQAGFTLIELIVVMVILGILAAVAIPQFTSVEGSARDAVAQGACSALTSSATLLYASNKTSSTFSTINGNVSTTGGTFTWAGSCSAPTVKYKESGGTTFSTTITCATLPSSLCSG